MSASYNARLKPKKFKGLTGDPEYFDSDEVVNRNVRALAALIRQSKHVVVHTGGVCCVCAVCVCCVYVCVCAACVCLIVCVSDGLFMCII